MLKNIRLALLNERLKIVNKKLISAYSDYCRISKNNGASKEDVAHSLKKCREINDKYLSIKEQIERARSISSQ